MFWIYQPLEKDFPWPEVNIHVFLYKYLFHNASAEKHRYPTHARAQHDFISSPNHLSHQTLRTAAYSIGANQPAFTVSLFPSY